MKNAKTLDSTPEPDHPRQSVVFLRQSTAATFDRLANDVCVSPSLECANASTNNHARRDLAIT